MLELAFFLWLWIAIPLLVIGILVIAIALLLFGRQKMRLLICSTVLCLACLGTVGVFREFYLWQFDLARGWSARVSVPVGDHEVALVQKAGGDFYETTVEVMNPAGQIATILVDGDAGKFDKSWVETKDGKTLLLGENRDRGSYPSTTTISVDAGSVTLNGWDRGTFQFSELDYESGRQHMVPALPANSLAAGH